MQLKQKLLLAMLTPTLLIVVVGVVGVLALDHLRQAATTILDDNYGSIQDSRRMERALWRIQSPVAGQEQVRGLTESVAEFDSALARCGRNITEHGEGAVIDSIQSAWQELHGLVPSDDRDEARGERMQVLAARIHGDIARLVDLNESSMVAHERRAGRLGRWMTAMVAVCALGAMLALALFALIWAARIARPVTEVADRLHSALNPDHVNATDTAGDEISRLRTEVDALLDRLDRHEAEQNRRLVHLRGRLAFVIDEVREGIVLLDAAKNILAVNRVARELLGVPGGGGGRSEGPGAPAQVRRLLQPVLDRARDTPSDPGELRRVIDGDERVYQLRALPFSSATGAPDGQLLILWDITEQRRYEETRERFVSMLSHQLKSPMTSLTMSLNLLREGLGPLAPEQAELLTIATEDCSKLSALISELISAPRRAAPGLSLESRCLDVVSLLRETLRPLLPQAREKGVTLVRPDGTESAQATVDPVKFSWVVTNIAGNALRYTRPGGRITVSVVGHGSRLEVTVSDTGRGIDPHDLQNVFEPYVTPDASRKPGIHGLGLAIAREIVEAHSGRIEVESELGRGTTFRILIPPDPEVVA